MHFCSFTICDSILCDNFQNTIKITIVNAFETITSVWILRIWLNMWTNFLPNSYPIIFHAKKCMKSASSVQSAGLSQMQYSEMRQRINLEITVVSIHLYTNYSLYSTNFAHTLCFRVSYNSQNKQLLFPFCYKFLLYISDVFIMTYEMNLYQLYI